MSTELMQRFRREEIRGLTTRERVRKFLDAQHALLAEDPEIERMVYGSRAGEACTSRPGNPRSRPALRSSTTDPTHAAVSRPAFVIALEGGIGKGSGRSLPGVAALPDRTSKP